ncbi:MAG: hypothetical protein AABZ13_02365, partial [Planctomycetota bacterium]
KGRKYIARGEAPGEETKDNKPRRGDRKGRTTGTVKQGLSMLPDNSRITAEYRILNKEFRITRGFSPLQYSTFLVRHSILILSSSCL